MANTKRHIDVVDAAKMLRKALRSRFPETRFSVRSSRYSGGASINVRWTDGPAENDVREVTRRYTGASFNGMIDLKEYHDSVIAGEDGQPERVHFGADFVFTDRRFSTALLTRVVREVCERRGWDMPDIVPASDGTSARVSGAPYDVETAVYRAAKKRTADSAAA